MTTKVMSEKDPTHAQTSLNLRQGFVSFFPATTNPDTQRTRINTLVIAQLICIGLTILKELISYLQVKM